MRSEIVTGTMTGELPPLRRWDPLVRATHWGIVLAVIANALVVEEGSSAHVWIGYGLAALFALRLLWGVIGPAEARFAAFPPSPSRALAHIREIAAGKRTSHRSHNPLGALMVYAIWGCLSVIIATGIALAPPSAAPWTDLEGSDRIETHQQPSASAAVDEEESARRGEAGEHEEGPLTEVHEVAVNLLYLLIALHIAGVVFETRRSGRQIIIAMLPWPAGRKH